MENFDKIKDINKAGVSYGSSMAASETMVLVGAPGETVDGNTNAGLVYVYDKNGAELFTVAGDSNGADFNTGYSVGLAGTDILIGVPGINNNDGDVYRNDSDGNPINNYSATGITGSRFGESVASDGTYVVIGAPKSSTNGTDSGLAYIFTLDGSLIATLTPSTPVVGSKFGSEVAIHEGKILVSAPYEDGSDTGSGAVYVFDTTGSELGKIVEPSTGVNNNFGSSIGINDKYIYISSPGESTDTATGGAVYLYDMSYTEVKMIIPSNDEAENRFGTSLSVSDVNIMIGAPGDDTVANNAGSVIVYDIDGNEIKVLDLGTVDAGSNLGTTVAIADGVLAYGGTDAVSFNKLNLAPFKEINLDAGINTFGNTIDVITSLSKFKTKMDVCKTIKDGQWTSWTNDAPDSFQGMLDIEPGRGYVANAIAAFNYKFKGPDVDVNSIPVKLGYNLLAIPDTNQLGAGYLPRMKFDSVKTMTGGSWKSWVAGADAGLQGFTTSEPTNGCVYNVTELYGNVVDATDDSVDIKSGDTTVGVDTPAVGVKLTAPGLAHTITFNEVTYDAATPANVMFYTVDGSIGKVDYPSELEGTKLTINVNGKSYVTVFTDGSTYSTPTTTTLDAGLNITKADKTIASDTTYTAMNLIVDGSSYVINYAAEYEADTFQVWKDGDMREGTFAAGDVTITFS